MVVKKPRYKKADGIPICKVQQIIDNPDLNGKELARKIGINVNTVYKIRNELDIKPPRTINLPPRRLVKYAKGNIERALQILERHGKDEEVTYKQVLRWCECDRKIGA